MRNGPAKRIKPCHTLRLRQLPTALIHLFAWLAASRLLVQARAQGMRNDGPLVEMLSTVAEFCVSGEWSRYTLAQSTAVLAHRCRRLEVNQRHHGHIMPQVQLIVDACRLCEIAGACYGLEGEVAQDAMRLLEKRGDKEWSHALVETLEVGQAACGERLAWLVIEGQCPIDMPE